MQVATFFDRCSSFHIKSYNVGLIYLMSTILNIWSHSSWNYIQISCVTFLSTWLYFQTLCICIVAVSQMYIERLTNVRFSMMNFYQSIIRFALLANNNYLNSPKDYVKLVKFSGSRSPIRFN